MTQTEEDDSLNFGIRYPKQGLSPLQIPRPFLSFAIRDDNDFCFCVSIKAGGQDYILSYAPRDGNCTVSGQTIYHPLGTEYKNGQWHLCKRDLRKDLDPVGKTLEFEWVNNFELWGDCRLDDLWLSYHPIDYLIFPIKLNKGLNLINLPIKPENLDSQALSQLLTGDISESSKLKRRNAYKQQWEKDFHSVREDQGFILYSPQEKWITIKGSPKGLKTDDLAFFLKSGVNLISPPSATKKRSYYGADLLNDLRSHNQKIQGIHTYDQIKGAWSSRTHFFNQSAGQHFEIHQGKGYMVYLGR